MFGDMPHFPARNSRPRSGLRLSNTEGCIRYPKKKIGDGCERWCHRSAVGPVESNARKIGRACTTKGGQADTSQAEPAASSAKTTGDTSSAKASPRDTTSSPAVDLAETTADTGPANPSPADSSSSTVISPTNATGSTATATAATVEETQS
jgi:hypothetical protein